MIHEELSREVIGAAMAVLNELKPGLDEKLYERAMTIELAMHLIVTPDSSYPCHPCNPWFSCFDYGEGDRLD
jgi:hypothetical protein